MTAARRAPLNLIQLLSLNAGLNQHGTLGSPSECLHIADHAALSLIDLTTGMKSVAAMAVDFAAPYGCPVEKAAMQESTNRLLSEVAAIATELAYLAQQAVDAVKDSLAELDEPDELDETPAPAQHQWEWEAAE